MADARYENTWENPEYAPLGERVMWRKPNGDNHWTRLYAPSDAALKWDDAEWANAAVGTLSLDDKAAYAYVVLRKTGRKERLVPNTGGHWGGGVYGVKAKITLNKNTEYEDTVDCWVVEDRS